jgi:hypothetical protein
MQQRPISLRLNRGLLEGRSETLAHMSSRITWEVVPESIHHEIEALLGARVIQADNQTGGFSPGLAARCALSNGKRCFIKAVSISPNMQTPDIHRREGRIAKMLPVGVPAPRLLHTLDTGEWVALVFEDVDGRMPGLPWSVHDLQLTLRTLSILQRVAPPSELSGLPSMSSECAEQFRGFRTVAGLETVPGYLDDWTAQNLDRLAGLEERWNEYGPEDSLVHCDMRADNVLIQADDTMKIVDWPWACTGPSWADFAAMLPSVGMNGGPSPWFVESQLNPFAGIDPTHVTRLVAALAGYFTFAAAQPEPVGLTGLRSFQRRQGDVARAWVRHRLQ